MVRQRIERESGDRRRDEERREQGGGGVPDYVQFKTVDRSVLLI